MSKIAVLGTGEVAKALAKGLVGAKYDVMVGTRDPKSEKAQAFLKETGAKSIGTFADAATFGNALKLADPKNMKGKTVIDTTNPLVAGYLVIKTVCRKLELEIGFNNSGGEEVQKWLPESHVVKAFNIIGNAHMVNPEFKGQKPDMWIAGNDEGAKKQVWRSPRPTQVTELLGKLGWSDHVIDAGDGIKGSRLLEPMCVLWCKFAFTQKPFHFNHAFALLRK